MVGLGDRIKLLRKREGLTQKQVGERIGVSKAMISSYELSVRTPSYDVLIGLASLFRVTTDYLLGVERERSIGVGGLSEANIALVGDLVKALKANQ